MATASGSILAINFLLLEGPYCLELLHKVSGKTWILKHINKIEATESSMQLCKIKRKVRISCSFYFVHYLYIVF